MGDDTTIAILLSHLDESHLRKHLIEFSGDGSEVYGGGKDKEEAIKMSDTPIPSATVEIEGITFPNFILMNRSWLF